MNALVQELRLAIRLLARTPGFTALAVVTLALGIGGATTMYGFLQAVARQSQPTVPEAERVARLFTAITPRGDERGQVSLDGYNRWSEAASSFETLAAYSGQTRLLRTARGEDEVDVLAVTPSYLSLLKTAPVAGRYFTEEEVRAGAGRVALLSERAWHSRFGGEAAALGRSLDLDGQSHTVVGVVSERLGLVMGSTDFFVPLRADNDAQAVMVLGRRRPGVSWAQVGAEMEAIGVGDGRAKLHVRVVPILDDAAFRTRAMWLLAVGPAILVLLIGCGNVASLLLVRAVNREREMAVRLALGASRRRLAAQLLIEGWTLAASAAALGVVLAWLGLLGIRALLAASVDVRVGLDTSTLVFAGIAMLLTPLAFGLAPLLHSLRVDLTGAMRASLHKPLFGAGRYHLRDLFAILEMGMAVGLVAFALMLLSWVSAIRSIDLNFEGAGLVVARVAPPGGEKREATGDLDIPRLVRERVAAIPGVSHVTTGDLPFGGSRVRVGRSSSGDAIPAQQVRGSASYLAILRLPITLGRGFDDADAGSSAGVAVVNESMAARLWPGANPLGQVLYVTGGKKTEAMTVVGVSRDAVRLGRLDTVDAHILGFRYTFYRPWPPGASTRFNVIARVDGRPPSLFGPIREAIGAADPRLHLRNVTAMAAKLDLLEGEEGVSFPLYLLGGFGVLALLLAAIGVFGVMSQVVDERRTELGIRLALGASPRGVVCLVVRDGLIRVGVGAGLGLLGPAVAVRTGFAGLLSATAPDPWLWSGIVAALTLTAAAACYLPARRAVKIDPMVALRCE
jgi:putative ABC transport system permease protein